jgi:hypothetical protein
MVAALLVSLLHHLSTSPFGVLRVLDAASSLVRLSGEMNGFHWIVSYGGYPEEMGDALRKMGVEWLDLSA